MALFQAKQETKLARRQLQDAVKRGFKNVWLATHVPPFVGATWHEGLPSQSPALPWFCSVTMGEMLMEVTGEHPDVTFTVLCGHTHGAGIYKPSSNLTVRTAGAEYGRPAIHAFLDFAHGVEEVKHD